MGRLVGRNLSCNLDWSNLKVVSKSCGVKDLQGFILPASLYSAHFPSSRLTTKTQEWPSWQSWIVNSNPWAQTYRPSLFQNYEGSGLRSKAISREGGAWHNDWKRWQSSTHEPLLAAIGSNINHDDMRKTPALQPILWGGSPKEYDFAFAHGIFLCMPRDLQRVINKRQSVNWPAIFAGPWALRGLYNAFSTLIQSVVLPERGW